MNVDVFVPAYDPPTVDNLNYLLSFLCRSGLRSQVTLFDGGNASSAALLNALRTQSSRVFAMSHGLQYAILADQGNFSLTDQDAAAVKSEVIFAYACHTAWSFGPAVSKSGAPTRFYFGFDRPVSPPYGDPRVLEKLDPVFSYIFHAVRNILAMSLGDFAATLRWLCNEARSDIFDLVRSTSGINPGSAAQVLFYLENDLVVCFDGVVANIKTL